MKSPIAEKYITREVIRRSNSALVSGERRFDKGNVSRSVRAAMPSREQIIEAGRNALGRMREKESSIPA